MLSRQMRGPAAKEELDIVLSVPSSYGLESFVGPGQRFSPPASASPSIRSSLLKGFEGHIQKSINNT